MNGEKTEAESQLVNMGTVIELMNTADLKANNCFVKVEWANGRTKEYRRGYEGKMDVVCVKPSAGPSYYADHLPTLSE